MIPGHPLHLPLIGMCNCFCMNDCFEVHGVARSFVLYDLCIQNRSVKKNSFLRLIRCLIYDKQDKSESWQQIVTATNVSSATAMFIFCVLVSDAGTVGLSLALCMCLYSCVYTIFHVCVHVHVSPGRSLHVYLCVYSYLVFERGG